MSETELLRQLLKRIAERAYAALPVAVVILSLALLACVLGWGSAEYCEAVMNNLNCLIMVIILISILITVPHIISRLAAKGVIAFVLGTARTRPGLYRIEAGVRSGVSEERLGISISTLVPKRYSRVARLLEVLDGEGVLTVKDVEEMLSRRYVVLDVLG